MKTLTSVEKNVSCLLSVQEAAQRLGVSVPFLAKLRGQGSPSLPFVKIGARVLYENVALEAFIASRRRMSTRDRAAA